MPIPAWTVLLTVSLLLSIAAPWARAESLNAWSAAELRDIETLGPWPQPQRADPTNRVSGQPMAIELGRQLFRDPRMSPIGYIACVTCHQPDRAFTDQRARAHGLADLPRNTPALANLRLQQWFGWDGASDSLWLASVRPMLDAREFDGTPTSITRIFERVPELASCYSAVFGAAPVRDAQRTIVNVGKAMAAFQETLVTERTAFDEFRDALLRGDTQAMASYPAQAQRGLRLFVGSAGCVGCHSGPNMSDGRFHAVLERNPSVAVHADDGRMAGVRRLRAEPMNLQGRFNDNRFPTATVTVRAQPIPVAQESMSGQFRTPGLRNVAVTGPYMHDGRFDHLSDVLDHGRDPIAGGDAPGDRLLASDRDDLVAFLVTLTDRYGARRPWSTQALASCP